MDFDAKRPRPQVSGGLFEAVQRGRVFPDSKTFVDAEPITGPDKILSSWEAMKDLPGFDLEMFVRKHFRLPSDGSETVITKKDTCKEHIKELWPALFREPDKRTSPNSSLIPLPYPYVVPGGRFREIYYWDSYFTARGLAVDGHQDMVVAMVRNFAWLISNIGHIPNGNRAYYLSRSQPPFFTPMVSLVEELLGEEMVQQFIPEIEKEYAFWMDKTGTPNRRCLRLETGQFLNRYWDDNPAPREESWIEDVELAEKFPESDHEAIYRNIRAACESGWDFSSRWLSDGFNLASIDTTNVLPVDLNTLLWFTEKKLSDWHHFFGAPGKAEYYRKKAQNRADAMNANMWDKSEGFFFDYHLKLKKHTGKWSLASVYPLYFGLADNKQAAKIAKNLEKKFLKPGGLPTTLIETGQQWDLPNGWAPLQWLAIKGLERYGHDRLAGKIRKCWLDMNEDVYQRTGKMVEKYNVMDASQEGGGGEYPLQDGFGWSNGVFRALQGK